MSASLDSTTQTGQPSGGDWQEEVYQKVKTMKENYLPELSEMYQKIAGKLQQDQLEKLNVFKMMLERIITFLQVSKSDITSNHKEKLGSYEKQIINFINTNRSRKTLSSLPPGQLPPPPMHFMSQLQTQVNEVQSHENQMNSQVQSNKQGAVAAVMQHNSLSGVSTAQQSMMNTVQPSINLDSGQGNSMNSLQQVPVSSLQQNPVTAPQQTNVNSLSSQAGVYASLDSTTQTGQPSGGDWQEEVYQKVKTMKENYLLELSEMYQKIAAKLQQQRKSDQLEQVNVFKMMLERIITFLQVSKSDITLNHKEKLGSYEKQIINFINSIRSRKTMSSLPPGQLPPPPIHFMSQLQTQVNEVQSHENQMNSQVQSNMQGPVAAVMQHNSLSGVSTAQQSMMNTAQPSTNLDSGQGNSFNSLQQVPVSSLQQNPVTAPQQTNVNSLSSQAGVCASLDSTTQTGQPSGGDWQEEVYQKVKTMKENYLPELSEMYQKIAGKLQQQPKSDQLEKLNVFKMMLERVITFLQVSKSDITPNHKEKLGSYEKQILNFINL